MLIITGLLTLLAVAHAEGDHIKGGSRIKGGSLIQEQVSQEDIPSMSSLKTVAAYGSKIKTSEPTIKTVPPVITQVKTVSKTASAPALHHAVKTMADKYGKIQPVPAMHHAATLPVAQDQVAIDEQVVDPVSSTGIKTLKTVTSVKSKFEQVDTQVRDPIAHPVIQTVKTVKDPILEPRDIKTIKTAETGKIRFSPKDTQIRDPITRPLIQTVKTTADPTTDSLKTQKTITRGNTRFLQQDTQVRDPVARPVVQTVKTVEDSFINLSKKTLRDPIARPVVQTVKTVDDSPLNLSQKTVKTSIKTSEPSTLRTKTVTKTSQENIDSSIISSVPESIVSAARRNTLRTILPPEVISTDTQSRPSTSDERQNIRLLSNSGSPVQAGLGTVNEKGEIILDEETLELLYNAGSIVKENGEISLNEQAMGILQNIRGGTFSPVSSRIPTETTANAVSRGQISGQNIRSPSDRSGTDIKPLLRITTLGQTQRSSNPNRRKPISSRVIASGPSTRSQSNVLQNPNSRGNIVPLSFTNTGSVTDRDQMLRSGDISGIQRDSVRQLDKPAIDLKFINDQNMLLTESFGQRNTVRSSETGRVIQGTGSIQDGGRLNLETGFRNQGTVTAMRGSSRRRTGTQITGSRSVGMLSPLSTVENNEGIISDNLNIQRSIAQQRRPVLITEQAPRLRVPKPAANYGSNILSTRVSTQNKPQIANILKDDVKLRTRAKPPVRLAEVSRAQTGSISASTLRSQEEASRRSHMTTTNEDRILFNGKEISISGLQSGQLFDENLRPLLSGPVDSTQAEDFKFTTINQNIKPGTIQDIPRVDGVPTIGTGALLAHGVSQRRQQAHTLRDDQKLRIPARSSTIISDQANVRTTNERTSFISTDINQPTPAVNAETVLFDGKEINIHGLRAGQLFDENLQPLLTDNVERYKPEDIKASIISNTAYTASSPGNVQSASGPVISPNYGTDKPLNYGNIRRRQQNINIAKDKIKLRTPAGSQSLLSGQTDTRQITSTDALRSTNIRQSTTTGSAETIYFNGKEINISGLNSGQLFDENLQPLLSDKTRNTGPIRVRTSNMLQNAKPASRATVSGQRRRKPIVASRQSLPIPKQGILTNRQFEVPSGVIRSTTGIRVTPDINIRTLNTEIPQNPEAIGRVTISPGQQISGVFGSRNTIASRSQQLSGTGIPQISSVTSNEKLYDILKLRNSGAAQTINFNGEEINIDGLKAGQLFDENLQPISSGISYAPKTGDKISSLDSYQGSQLRKPGNIVQTLGIRSPSGVQILKSGRQRSQLSTSMLRRTSQGIPNIPSTRQFETPSSGILRNTVSTSFERTPSTELRRSRIPQSRTSAQATLTGLQRSSPTGTRQQSGILTSGVMPSTADVLRTNTLVPQETPINSRRRLNVMTDRFASENLRSQGGSSSGSAGFVSSGPTISQIIPGLVSAENDRQIAPGLRVSGPIIPQDLRVESLRTNNVRTQQQMGLRTTSDRSPNTLTAQRTPAIHNPIMDAKADTVLFNGKEINIGGIREGQLFDENLRPILPYNSDGGAKIDDTRAFDVSQNIKPVNSLGTSQNTAVRRVSSTSRSGALISPGTRPRQQPAINAAKDILKMKIPSGSSTAISGQSNIQRGISRGSLRAQGITSNRQHMTGTNENTISFNGKEISIDGLRAGQLFDENLQPILSDDTGIINVDDVKASSVPQNTNTGSLTDIRYQEIPFGDSRTPEFTLSGISSSEGIVAPQRTASSGLTPTRQSPKPYSASLRRSGPQGLRSQTVSRQNPQSPGLRPSVLSPERLSSTLVDSGSLRNRLSGEHQTISGGLSNSPTSAAASRSRGSQMSSRFSSSDITRAGISDQSIVPRNIQYSSGSSPRGSDIQRKISQDRITQEITQDRIENPLIQEKPVAMILQKNLDPIESKQTQLNLEDVIEQKSLAKPQTLKTVQVQETVPFSVSEASPKTASKTTLAKISQVSQKDIDIPTFQQRIIAGDYAGYLPKTSFLPPFNYGLPQASKYRVKKPIVQEQQKVEQIFV